MEGGLLSPLTTDVCRMLPIPVQGLLLHIIAYYMHHFLQNFFVPFRQDFFELKAVGSLVTVDDDRLTALHTLVKVYSMEKLKSFASLAWYDACIEFLFKLAAKTSEPLLAIGIVYSAADVLSRGNLGYGNQGVQNAWAITQALAIELSGGVVLVYGLLSL